MIVCRTPRGEWLVASPLFADLLALSRPGCPPAVTLSLDVRLGVTRDGIPCATYASYRMLAYPLVGPDGVPGGGLALFVSDPGPGWWCAEEYDVPPDVANALAFALGRLEQWQCACAA